MKKSIESVFVSFVFLTILLSACAPASTPVPPTLTPIPPTPTSTPIPTSTNTPPSTVIINDVSTTPAASTTLDSLKGNIEGNVSWVNPQKPIRNVEIQIVDAKSSTLTATTETDAKGYYTFVNIEPDEYAFVFTVIIPGKEMVCENPNTLFDMDLNWSNLGHAYNGKNEWVDVWLSISNVEVQAGKIAHIDMTLKCP
jgi:SdrD B-like domain